MYILLNVIIEIIKNIYSFFNANFDFIKNLLLSTSGFFITVFSLYFSYQKIGHKILATKSISFERLSAVRIDDIILINCKNKPVVVFSIQVLINKKYLIKIEEFKPQIIIKPLESIHIKTTPISNYYLNSEKFEPDFNLPNKIDLIINSYKKNIKCKIISPPSLLKFKENSNNFEMVSITRNTFNNVIYDDNVLYGITYSYNNIQKTAFIDDSGFIWGDWNFKINGLQKESLKSEKDVKIALDSVGYDKLFQYYIIKKLK